MCIVAKITVSLTKVEWRVVPKSSLFSRILGRKWRESEMNKKVIIKENIKLTRHSGTACWGTAELKLVKDEAHIILTFPFLADDVSLQAATDAFHNILHSDHCVITVEK